MTDGNGAVAIPTSELMTKSFAELTEMATVISGARVLSKEQRPDLEGIPFAIIGATYRNGFPHKVDGKPVPTNYVNAEIIIGNQAALSRAVELGQVPNPLTLAKFDAEERIILNDGSTGFYRQLTAFLAARGHFILPDGEENGPSGTTRYESYRTTWTPIEPWSRLDYTGEDDDDPAFVVTFKQPLILKRGLRPSKYQNEYTKGEDATTLYMY